MSLENTNKPSAEIESANNNEASPAQPALPETPEGYLFQSREGAEKITNFKELQLKPGDNIISRKMSRGTDPKLLGFERLKVVEIQYYNDQAPGEEHLILESTNRVDKNGRPQRRSVGVSEIVERQDFIEGIERHEPAAESDDPLLEPIDETSGKEKIGEYAIEAGDLIYDEKGISQDVMDVIRDEQAPGGGYILVESRDDEGAIKRNRVSFQDFLDLQKKRDEAEVAALPEENTDMSPRQRAALKQIKSQLADESLPEQYRQTLNMNAEEILDTVEAEERENPANKEAIDEMQPISSEKPAPVAEKTLGQQLMEEIEQALGQSPEAKQKRLEEIVEQMEEQASRSALEQEKLRQERNELQRELSETRKLNEELLKSAKNSNTGGHLAA